MYSKHTLTALCLLHVANDWRNANWRIASRSIISNTATTTQLIEQILLLHLWDLNNMLMEKIVFNYKILLQHCICMEVNQQTIGEIVGVMLLFLITGRYACATSIYTYLPYISVHVRHCRKLQTGEGLCFVYLDSAVRPAYTLFCIAWYHSIVAVVSR